jgi:hypothetical protein
MLDEVGGNVRRHDAAAGNGCDRVDLREHAELVQPP